VRLSRSPAAVIFVLTVLVGAAACGQSKPSRAHPRPDAGASVAAVSLDLPLARDSTERRTRQSIRRGVSYEHIVYGRASREDFFTIEIGATAERAEADRIAAGVHAGEQRARVEQTRDGRRWRVRVGRYADRPAAERALTALGEVRIEPPPGTDPDETRAHAHIVFTGEDGLATTGPWSIHVLEIDPRSGARVDLALAHGHVEGRETVRSIAARERALAAVNAGYFVMDARDGTPGDPAGACVLRGALVSESVEGRTALVLAPPRSGAPWRARVTKVHTRIRVLAPSGAARDADGINRTAGLVRNCGGSGGDRPAEAPMHDFTCTDPNELIVLDAHFGPRSPEGQGVEIVLGAGGRVHEVRARRGGEIPRDARIVAGIGDAADWIRAQAPRNATIRLEMRVTDDDGRELEPGATVVNGGPRLLRDGHLEIPAREEGFDYPQRPDMLEHFALRRHPRTIAAVTRDGRLLLIVVDGRQPGRSAGLTFDEEAHLARALGAIEAVNLDGGGSTTIVIGGRVVNSPSDPSGERTVSDALIVR